MIGETPSKLKDSILNLLIKSLSGSASQSLHHLHLENLRVNSEANAEALGHLVERQAACLETLYLENIFGKKKLVSRALGGLGRMQSRSTLSELTLKQGDLAEA